MTAEPCAGAAALIKIALHRRAWHYVFIPAVGTALKQEYGPPRGDGTRPKVMREVPCRSQTVRLAGPGRCRAAAMWVNRGEKWESPEAWVWTRAEDRDVPATFPQRVLVTDLEAVISIPWAV